MPPITKHRYVRCTTCGGWGYAETHRCPPAWPVGLLENVDAQTDHDRPPVGRWMDVEDVTWWIKVYARTPQAAAARYLERQDAAEFGLTREAVVVVKDLDTPGQLFYFAVHGQLVPVYEAEPLPDLETARDAVMDLSL